MKAKDVAIETSSLYADEVIIIQDYFNRTNQDYAQTSQLWSGSRLPYLAFKTTHWGLTSKFAKGRVVMTAKEFIDKFINKPKIKLIY